MRTESQTTFGDFGACPRLYENKYIKGLRPATESASLSLGKLGHDVMEKYYNEGLEAAIAYTVEIGADDKGELSTAAVKVLGLLKGYDANYAQSEWKVVLNEAEFRLPLVNPETGRKSTTVEMVGKVDLVVEIAGKNWLVDHKFKGSPGERNFWAINSQADLYLSAMEARGLACEGVIWNIIRTPSIRQKQKETLDEYSERLAADTVDRPEFYYTRHIMKRWPEDIKDTMEDYWFKHQDLLRALNSKRFRREPTACHRYGTCPFLGLCANGINADMSEFDVVEKRHPELATV